MDIGVHTPPLYDLELGDALEYLSGIGVRAIEPGTGGFPGDDHLPRGEYLDDEDAQADLLDLLADRDMRISALATHNNPLHPDEGTAEEADTELRETVELAAQLDVNVVTCFSGLPAGGPNDENPNWVTAPWPHEHADMLDYQWEDVAIPYWRDLAEFADEHGVDLAIEMHPNMLVHEPSGMARLREATNDRVGANFDPSHLFWQRIDVPRAIRFLGGDAIHHFHAKDTAIYDAEADVKGVLDTTPYRDEPNRSWLFRTVGYGHGEEFWKDVVSTLRMVGYDGALSIEHEDSLTSGREGLEKAVDLLQRAVFETRPGEAYWA